MWCETDGEKEDRRPDGEKQDRGPDGENETEDLMEMLG